LEVIPSALNLTDSEAEIWSSTETCEIWKLLTSLLEDLASTIDPLKLNSAGKRPEYGNIDTICEKYLNTSDYEPNANL